MSRYLWSHFRASTRSKIFGTLNFQKDHFPSLGSTCLQSAPLASRGSLRQGYPHFLYPLFGLLTVVPVSHNHTRPILTTATVSHSHTPPFFSPRPQFVLATCLRAVPVRTEKWEATADRQVLPGSSVVPVSPLCMYVCMYHCWPPVALESTSAQLTAGRGPVSRLALVAAGPVRAALSGPDRTLNRAAARPLHLSESCSVLSER